MPPKRVGRLTGKDRQLVRSLYLAQRPLPLTKLAERTGMGWKTIQKSADKLHRLDVLNIEKSIRRTNISLKPNFLSILKSHRAGKK
jgi:DNA-binding transcriptional regulator GbsR (MarR family)